MKLYFSDNKLYVAAKTAYAVFHARSYHAGEFWRLKDSKKKMTNFLVLNHDGMIWRTIGP